MLDWDAVATLTEQQAGLFLGRNFGVVATLKPGGAPQATVVWVDYDGENVVFNTTRPRAKGRHLARDPRLSVAVWDAGNPYRFVEVQGRAELDDEGADEHIRKLARKYWGTDYPNPRDRVIVRVRPDFVYAYGLE